MIIAVITIAPPTLSAIGGAETILLLVKHEAREDAVLFGVRRQLAGRCAVIQHFLNRVPGRPFNDGCVLAGLGGSFVGDLADINRIVQHPV